MNGPLRIDVVSDVVCPWCFIGKRHLDAALAGWRADHPEVPVEIRWQPYFLNPDTSVDGEPYRPFLERKFGGAQAVDELQARVAAAGKRAGVEFAFEKIALRANTLRAHRLLHLAQGLAAKVSPGETAPDIDSLVEALFAAHFVHGEHVGAIDVLVRAAHAAGLDTDKTRAFLASDTDADVVRAAAGRARQIGVSGVPCFIFDGRLASVGAQPPETLRLGMEQALATS